MTKKVTFQRVATLIQRAAERAKTPSGRSQVEEVSIHDKGYAEPGYDAPESGIVCTGNWNAITRWDSAQNKSVVLDNAPAKLGERLEKLGVVLEWSDEWSACAKCGKLVRTRADSYSWTRQYWERDGDTVCVDCVQEDPEEYLQSLEGSTEHCLTIDGIDLTEHGYKLLEKDLENGLYGGQSADPKLIGEVLRKQGVERFIFQLDSTGQFDISFSVYVHEDDWDKLNQEEYDKAEKEGPDPTRQMEAYLQDASRVINTVAPGQGTIVISPDPDDPTKARVRIVSPQDFIEGKALD